MAAETFLDALHDLESARGTARILLVMLPGATHKPTDFVRHGFIDAVRARKLPVDVVAVDAHLGYYLERTLVTRLSEDIIGPAKARGYEHIWIAGISLGGMGALNYARAHAGDVTGVIVLAPFLGVRGTIEEIVRAGGIDQWHPGTIEPQDDERRLLAWVKAYGREDPPVPRVHLGYGTEDRFVAASRILGERVPATNVTTASGSHDWETWRALWDAMLDNHVLGCGVKSAAANPAGGA